MEKNLDLLIKYVLLTDILQDVQSKLKDDYALWSLNQRSLKRPFDTDAFKSKWESVESKLIKEVRELRLLLAETVGVDLDSLIKDETCNKD